MNENNMDQKIIERLQKLLALAASDNEHEADTCYEQGRGPDA